MKRSRHALEVVEVNGLVDLPHEVRGNHLLLTIATRWLDRFVLQQKASTAGYQHRSHLNHHVPVEPAVKAVLKEGNPVPASPHVGGDIPEQIVIKLAVTCDMKQKSMLLKRVTGDWNHVSDWVQIRSVRSIDREPRHAEHVVVEVELLKHLLNGVRPFHGCE